MYVQSLPEMQSMKISTGSPPMSKDVQQPAGVKIPCRSLTATEEFKCSANELYRALTDREVLQKSCDCIAISCSIHASVEMCGIIVLLWL